MSPQNIEQKSSASHPHTMEYKLIKHDLIKVVILNVVYLAAILALYYGNQKNHFLENWFAKFFQF